MGSDGMSANIWCWSPVLGLLASSPNFVDKVAQLQESVPQPPAAIIVDFVGALLKRYPELSKNQTNTAWAVGPLLRDANGQFIDIGIQSDHYDDAGPFVVQTAHQFGLSCYDPQNGRSYPAK